MGDINYAKAHTRVAVCEGECPTNRTWESHLNYADGFQYISNGMLDPSYSPDGTLLIFTHISRHHIYVLDLASGQFELVNVYSDYIKSPTIAADNHTILFLGDNQFGNIYVTTRGPNNPLRLLWGDGEGGLFDPCISPDGTWAAFACRTDYYGYPSLQIATCAIDGSNCYLYTSPRSTDRPDNRWPSISADSLKMVNVSGQLVDAALGLPATWGASNISYSTPVVTNGIRFCVNPSDLPHIYSTFTTYLFSCPTWWPTGDGVVWDFLDGSDTVNNSNGLGFSSQTMHLYLIQYGAVWYAQTSPWYAPIDSVGPQRVKAV